MALINLTPEQRRKLTNVGMAFGAVFFATGFYLKVVAHEARQQGVPADDRVPGQIWGTVLLLIGLVLFARPLIRLAYDQAQRNRDDKDRSAPHP